jgi:hypothetical protein
MSKIEVWRGYILMAISMLVEQCSGAVKRKIQLDVKCRTSFLKTGDFGTFLNMKLLPRFQGILFFHIFRVFLVFSQHVPF